MRKVLIVFVVLLVIVLAAASIADIVIRHTVQGDIAKNIDQQTGAQHSSVDIDSFPFTGHLAVSGDVPTLKATVTDVPAGPLTLDTVHVTVKDLKVDKHKLFGGTVQLKSIKQATVVATISQASIQHNVGIPVTLGDGTVGLDGVQVPATLSITDDTIHLKVPVLPQVSLKVPLNGILPCLGSATISPGVLTVSCVTDKIPPAIASQTGKL